MIGNWLHFAERTGKEGREWSSVYRGHLQKVALSDLALRRLQKGDMTGGKEALERLCEELSAMPDEDDSIQAVLSRWYYGVESYYFYRLGDFSAARHCLQLAEDAVIRAISRADWLLMLAIHCNEFCLHRARIARDQHSWQEMHSYIGHARGMVSGDFPLCTKENGETISFATFRSFFSRVATLTDDERLIAAQIDDEDERTMLFDRFVRRMIRASCSCIEYY